MLVEYRPSHLRYTTDPTAASLQSTLRPTIASRSGSASEAPAASGGLMASDLRALYPAIFADEKPARSTADTGLVRRLVAATALVAQFSFSAVWHLIR